MTYEQGVLLTGSAWPQLSEEKKLAVLQAIENHAAFTCGRLPCPVAGKFLYTGSDGIVLGAYDPQNQVIYVNSSQFDADAKYGGDAQALVTACLHEGRHAYQHQAVRGLVRQADPAQVALWKDNLADGHYISFRQDPRAYYQQPVEADARRFAEEKYAQLAAQRQGLEAQEASLAAHRALFERQLAGEEAQLPQAACFAQDEGEAGGIAMR